MLFFVSGAGKTVECCIANMTHVNKFVVFIYVTLTHLVVAWQTGSVAGESPTGSRVSRP